MPSEITPRDLAARLARGEPTFLLDVREPWEYARAALPQSVLVPLRELPARYAALAPPQGALVVTICHHGMRSLDAQVYGLRLGPYLEFPLSQKWTVGLSGGFALAYADSRFKYNETVSSPGTPSVFSSGSVSDTKLLPGGYAGANISVLVKPNTRISAGVQYQNVGDFTQKVNGRRAKLDLGESLFFNVGVNFSF